MEESFIAGKWAYFLHKNYEPSDFSVFERWVDKHVSNWASCDTFCNHALGEYVEKFPGRVTDLKRWAKSKNRWMRRAAAVTLILPARRGGFLKDVFGIADILLQDEDDLVRKQAASKGSPRLCNEKQKRHAPDCPTLRDRKDASGTEKEGDGEVGPFHDIYFDKMNIYISVKFR
jgi:hypothetical protein